MSFRPICPGCGNTCTPGSESSLCCGVRLYPRGVKPPGARVDAAPRPGRIAKPAPEEAIMLRTPPRRHKMRRDPIDLLAAELEAELERENELLARMIGV